jgi:hypothetical protein
MLCNVLRLEGLRLKTLGGGKALRGCRLLQLLSPVLQAKIQFR